MQAQAQAVVKTRTNGDTGEPAHVMIPDHLDILAELACGAQAHMVFSDVTGLQEPPLHLPKRFVEAALPQRMCPAVVAITPGIGLVTLTRHVYDPQLQSTPLICLVIV